MSNCLINEPPLLVLPLLAKKIGLNEAILLQQIHYWLKRSKHEAGGERWVYNTYADWLEQLPFWSEKTLRRIVKNLEDTEILISTYEFNFSINKTKWYRINYTKLSQVAGGPSKTELIIDDYPLMFQPTLAVNYGINEAIFLQQLHYWLKFGNPKQQDANIWVVSSYKNWLKQFSFWSEDTLYRTIKKLTDMNLIMATGKYNDSPMDKTKWLTIRYDMFPISASPQSDQTSPQSDQTSPQGDQTSPQSDQTSPQGDQTTPQSDQTTPQSDQTTPQGDLIDTAERPNRHRKMTSPHYYIDYNTKTNTKTERQTTENASLNVATNYIHENTVQVQIVPEILDDSDNQKALSAPETQDNTIDAHSSFKTMKKRSKGEIMTQYNKAFNLYKELINENAIKKPTPAIEKQIEEGIRTYGDDFIQNLFDNVKKSDFLLGLKTFNIKLSWLIKNAENVISGKYINEDTASEYEQAQDCCLNEVICSVISSNTAPTKKCKYCSNYQNKKEKTLIQEKSPIERAEECAQGGFCPMEKYNIKHFKLSSGCSVCKFGVKENQGKSNIEIDLKTQAQKCFEKCKGMCSHRIMRTPPLEYCIYCPEYKNTPPSNTRNKLSSKKKNENTQELSSKGNDEIIVNYKNSDEVWTAAYVFINNLEEQRKITKLINKIAIFSVYSVSDLHSESLIVAYNTLMEFATTDSHVVLSKFQSHFYMNLKNHLIRKCTTIPALRDVMNTKNKSACSFYDFSEMEDVLDVMAAEEIENGLITNSEEIINILLGILTAKEEQVFRYRFGLTQRGKLTQAECGEIFNCTDKNILKIEKQAIDKIKEFIQNEKINKDTSTELLAEKVKEYQKHLKPIKFDGYFELGNLADVI